MYCYHTLSDIILSSVVKTLMNIWCRTVFLCWRYCVLLPIYVTGIRHNVITATTGHFQSGRLLYCVCVFRHLVQRGRLSVIVFIVGRYLYYPEVVDMSVLCTVDPVNHSTHVDCIHVWTQCFKYSYLNSTVVLCFFSWLACRCDR